MSNPQDEFGKSNLKSSDMEDFYKWREDPWNHKLDDERYNFTVSLIDTYKPVVFKSILDIGCGEGLSLSYIYNKFSHSVDITGVDISSTALSRASQKLEGKNINLIQADIGDKSFNTKINDTYDFVVVSDILYYLGGKFELAKSNILSLLNSNGILLIIEHVNTRKYSYHAFSNNLKLVIESRFKSDKHNFRYLVFSN